VLGAAWNVDNSPLSGARLRLRNAASAHIDATTIADHSGQFTFTNLEGGTYVIELVDESGRVLTVGHPFIIAPGETVATFVRLSARVPWYSGFFKDAAAAAVSTAAGQGITALAPIARPLSAKR
jgi:SdrD B-like protein